MKIENYALNLQGSSTQKTYHSVKENLQIWLTQEPIGNPIPLAASNNTGETIAPISATSTEGDDLFELSDKDKLKIKLIEEFVQLLTGKAFKFNVPKLQKKPAAYDHKGISRPSSRGTQNLGFGLIYNREEQKSTRTTVDFKASGIVKTEDGREIKFQSVFHVDQTLVESSQIQIKLGEALKDPLVIHFDGPIPEFNDASFEFDLLADGSKTQLKTFKSDSAYLAIDRNNNGKIDDGSELFGPKTNNGFDELRAYDQDQNGWIDENDAVFSQLKLWSRNENGEDQLLGLINKNIGAIYLGHVATGLDLYAASSQVGRIRDSGIVLSESGKTYSIQEIDVRL